MALHIAYEKNTDTLLKKLVRILTGPYVHTELVLSFHNFDDAGAAETDHVGYSTFMSETFSRIPHKEMAYTDDCHDFLNVPVTPEELYRLRKACDACVESKIPYNTSDMVLSQLPMRNPEEHDLYSSKALFCSQAVVLLLRVCLDKTHALQKPLAALNSRTVSPSHLYDAMRPFCSKRIKRQIFN